MRIFQHCEMSASRWLAGARREPSHIWYLIPNNNWNRNFIPTIDTHTHSLVPIELVNEEIFFFFFSFVRVELCTELVAIKMIFNTNTCTSECQQFYGHVLSFEAMRLAAYHNEWTWIRVEIQNLIKSIEIMRSARAGGGFSHGIYCSSNTKSNRQGGRKGDRRRRRSLLTLTYVVVQWT